MRVTIHEDILSESHEYEEILDIEKSQHKDSRNLVKCTVCSKYFRPNVIRRHLREVHGVDPDETIPPGENVNEKRREVEVALHESDEIEPKKMRLRARNSRTSKVLPSTNPRFWCWRC